APEEVKRAITVAALLAAACAHVELKPPATVEFELLGRIAARYAKDAFTGNLQWRHAGAGDEMLVTTPMGQGVARIVREGDGVERPSLMRLTYQDVELRLAITAWK